MDLLFVSGEQAKSGGGWGEETFCLRAVRSPAACPIEGRDPQKNVLILLEEKTGARKSEIAENIFLRGTRAERAAAGRFILRPDVRQSRFGF